MAEERTLGLARAHDQTAEDPSKEELQRRLDEARYSISNTVTEIKETVANQVQAVKDTLDWREQFKKRPVAWSAGAPRDRPSLKLLAPIKSILHRLNLICHSFFYLRHRI